MSVTTSHTPSTTILALLATSLLWPLTDAAAFSTGSPTCVADLSAMAPHGSATVPSPNGWSINVPLSYTAGTALTVTIANTNGSKQFRGLLLSVAKQSDAALAGTFTAPAGYVTTPGCGGSSLTHASSNAKPQRAFSFAPPAAGSGTLIFRAVVLEECGTSSCQTVYAFPNAIAVTESLYTLTVARGGDGTGTVIYNPSGIQCGNTCTADFVANQSVTLLALPGANSVFTAWLDCDSTVSDQCTVSMNRNRTATAMFQDARMDVDGSGLPTRYEAATDGVLVLRYLLGLRGVSLVNNARAGGATRDAAQIAAHLDARVAAMDIDGDGAVRATSDGLLILRYMLGLRGNVLIDGVNHGTLTATQIEAALLTLMPQPAQ